MKKGIATFALLLIAAGVFAQDSLNVSLLYHWEDPTLLPSSDFNNTYNEVWGFEQGGRHYAVIGSTLGTHFFDVTDAQNTVYIDVVPGASQGVHVVHRDYHDYEGYLYTVCDEGNSTMQIIDLQYLPDSLEVVYDDNNLLDRAHNIYIDTATAKMYACGSNELEVYSLANPVSPTLLVNCEFDIPWWSNMIGYVHDVFARNDTVYCNAGEEGWYIVDFSTPTSPVVLAGMPFYALQGYNHSGWLSDDGNTYIMADENHSLDMKSWDVSDLAAVTLLDTFSAGSHPDAIPHNQVIQGDYLYVSGYYDGLYIFDISDPSNITTTGYYDTSTEINTGGGYEGAWGVYPFLPGKILVSDMQNGLYVFDAASATVGVNNLDIPSTNFRIYPNPFKENIVIQYNGPNKRYFEYEVLDISGKVITSGNQKVSSMGTVQVHFDNNLSKGIYLVRIQSDGYVQTEKLIKTE
jgi:choice-of-anchor B domain-containing protein